MIPRTFDALRRRNYALFFTGQVLSLTGTWMERVALNQLVYELTGHDARWLGFVGAIPMIPALLLSLPAGALVDRVEPRRVVLVTQTLMLLGAATIAWIVLSGAAQPWHIAVYTAYSSATFAVDAAARQAMLVQLVPIEGVTNAVALNASMFSVSRFLGGAAFVAVVSHTSWGKGGCLALNAASFLCVIAGLLAMRLEPWKPHDGSADGRLLDGVRYAARTPPVLASLVVVVILSLFGFQLSHLLPVYAKEVFGRGEEGYGNLSAAVGVGSLVGSLALATIGGRAHRGRLMLAYAMLAPFALAAFASGVPFWAALLLAALAGFLMNQTQSACAALLQDAVPGALRGRVLSLYTLAVLTSFPLGALIGGYAAHEFGVQATTYADAAVIFAAVLCVRILWPSLRQTR